MKGWMPIARAEANSSHLSHQVLLIFTDRCESQRKYNEEINTVVIDLVESYRLIKHLSEQFPEGDP